MEIEEGEIVEGDHVVNVQIAGDSRKRTAEESMDGSVATKRMSMNAANGDTSNNSLIPDNSVEMAALQERVKKLERMYQRSCRSARESEIRAERAEKIIASMQKEGSTDGIVSKKEIVVKEESNIQSPIDNSAEMAVLQEKMKKMERMFEGACRTAREAELRAERAEQIIDSKHGIRESVDKNKETDQLQKRLAEISEELEKAMKREATRSLEDQKVIDEMKKKLTEAGKSNVWQGMDDNNYDELKERNAELNRLLCESMRRERYSQRVIKEHKQMEEKERIESAKETKDQADQLKEKETAKASEKSASEVVNDESKKQQRQQQRESKRKAIEKVEGLLASVSEKTDDFLAILTPCKIPGKFVDVDSAAIFLIHKYTHVWARQTPLNKMPKIEIKCCGKSIDKGNFIAHFQSKNHLAAMGKGSGGVSIAALKQWVEAMEGRKGKNPRGKKAPTTEPTAVDESPLDTTVEDEEAPVIEVKEVKVETPTAEPTAQPTVCRGTEKNIPSAGGSIKEEGGECKTKGVIGGGTTTKNIDSDAKKKRRDRLMSGWRWN